jgi:hypothetical protein
MIDYRISSFCSSGGCVEVGHAPTGAVVIRDSKDPLRSVAITVSGGAWSSFLGGIRGGNFDAESPSLLRSE